MNLNNLGVIGLSVMGSNLAKNFASRGFKTAIYNRTYTKTSDLLEDWKNAPLGDGQLVGYSELKDFIDSLERPRKVILMVRSGQPVDEFISHLLPFLDPEDIILDCGNSNWHDTDRRQKELEVKNIHFVGCGVSGGEEGALKGPSIMPGGSKFSVDAVLPLLEKVAAKDFQGNPCVTNVGLGASGHFVKMVHNAIEYVIMQGIAEIYDILKHDSLSNAEIADIFENINLGKTSSGDEYILNEQGLQSYLLDITVQILRTKDNLAEGDLVDKISDTAKAKGTGAWAVESSLELGVFTPSFASALYARIGSARNNHYIYSRQNQDITQKRYEGSGLDLIFGDILFSIHIAGFLQGLDLVAQANKDFNWGINNEEVWRIWQGGCIIRTAALLKLQAISRGGDMYEDFEEFIGVFYPVKDDLNALVLDRPTPVLDSVYSYFLTLHSANLPTNLIQAQRDYFGAHTYNRIDREGVFTGGWK